MINKKRIIKYIKYTCRILSRDKNYFAEIQREEWNATKKRDDYIKYICKMSGGYPTGEKP